VGASRLRVKKLVFVMNKQYRRIEFLFHFSSQKGKIGISRLLCRLSMVSVDAKKVRGSKLKHTLE